MNLQIVILDDDQKIHDGALVWELEQQYGKESVKSFTKPTDGLEYIKENLGSNLVILLDIQFPKNEMNGHELLEEIKNLSQLIPVILFSGIDENNETFSDFINNQAFGFVSKTATSEEVMSKIAEAINHLEASLDNAIEDWIIDKPGDKDKPIYFTGEGHSYSLNQILSEIRTQTEVGKAFAKRLNQLTIDLLLRNKEKIDG